MVMMRHSMELGTASVSISPTFRPRELPIHWSCRAMQASHRRQGSSVKLSASLRGDRIALRPKSNGAPVVGVGSDNQTITSTGNKTKRTAASSSNEPHENQEHSIKSSAERTNPVSLVQRRHGETSNGNAALILSNTHLVLRDLQDRSSFFQRNPRRPLPSFEPHEVEVGEVLGTGEFGVVLEIQKLRVPELQRAIQEEVYVNWSENRETGRHKPLSSSPAKDVSANDSVSQSSLPKSILVPSHKRMKGHANPTAPHQRRSSRSIAELEGCMSASASITSLEPMDGEGSIVAAVNAPVEPCHEVPPSFPHHCQHSAMDDEIVQEHDHDSLDSAITSSTANHKQQVAEVLEKTRHCLSEHVHRDGMARYALKRLRLPPNSERSGWSHQQARNHHDTQHVMNATIDLACEATFLASLAHSNIVRLRATVGKIGHTNFCIIMDRLTDTLEDRMVTWVARSQLCRPNRGLASRLWCKRSNDMQQAWQQLYADRLLAAFDIARAIRYLHAQKIIYRDLKPDNVGFDVRGNVRIFDFGLAKELKKHDLVEPPDKYDATGLTGSRRFMAPECIKCLPYGFSADVYSYSILFWQMFSLQVPFPNNNVRKHYEQVVMKQKRPNKHAAKVSPMLMNMMTSGWDDEPSKRPSFKQICQQLQVEIMDVTADGAGGASIVDRSTHLMNRSLNSFYNNIQKESFEEIDDGF